MLEELKKKKIDFLKITKNAVKGAAVVGKKAFNVCNDFADKIEQKFSKDDLKNMVTLNSVDLTEIQSWFAQFKDNKTYIGVVTVPDEVMEKMLHVQDLAENQHLLIQMVYDNENEKIVEKRLICYSFMELQFQDLLSKNNGSLTVKF